MPHDTGQPEPAGEPADRPDRDAVHDPGHDRAVAAELLAHYAAGRFPMADPSRARPGEPAPIYIIDPPTRAVIPLADDALRVPRSLRQRVRAGRFTMTADAAFGRVIRACSRDPALTRQAGLPTPPPPAHALTLGDADDGSWIDARLVALYEALFRLGHAHSVEAWLDADGPGACARGPTLVGGLYGVALGGLFAGESMFSRPDLGGTDASKACLVHLWHHLRARGFALLDCQFQTPHLARLGAVEITRAEYRRRLRDAVRTTAGWDGFDPDRARRALATPPR